MSTWVVNDERRGRRPEKQHGLILTSRGIVKSQTIETWLVTSMHDLCLRRCMQWPFEVIQYSVSGVLWTESYPVAGSSAHVDSSWTCRLPRASSTSMATEEDDRTTL